MSHLVQLPIEQPTVFHIKLPRTPDNESAGTIDVNIKKGTYRSLEFPDSTKVKDFLLDVFEFNTFDTTAFCCAETAAIALHLPLDFFPADMFSPALRSNPDTLNIVEGMKNEFLFVLETSPTTPGTAVFTYTVENDGEELHGFFTIARTTDGWRITTCSEDKFFDSSFRYAVSKAEELGL